MDPAPPDDRAKMRRWVEAWKVAGEELDRMKWDELRAMTEDDAARMLDLQHWPTDDLWRSPERESAEGMIEQQRMFLRLHELSADR